MNKFDFNKAIFVQSLRIYLIITIAIYFAANVSHTPHLIAYGVATIISFILSVEYMFFDNHQERANFMLGRSIIVTIGLTILTLSAYYDELVLNL